MSAPKKFEAKVTHHSPAAPEAVYDALIDPEALARWQRSALRRSGLPGDVVRAEIDPVEGGAFFYSDRREAGEARHWGNFRVLHRPTRIVHTWITDESQQDDPSVVTIVIEPAPDGDGATVTLYHDLALEWAEYSPRIETSWRHVLEAVDETIAAGP